VTEDGSIVQERAWLAKLCLHGKGQLRRPTVVDRHRRPVLADTFQETAPRGQDQRTAPEIPAGVQLMPQHGQEEFRDAIRPVDDESSKGVADILVAETRDQLTAIRLEVDTRHRLQRRDRKSAVKG